jgi:TatA/E family protein of Tat protein translocase
MGIGGSEILLIFLAVLLLFGSKKMPEVARGLGKGLQEFKKATDEIKKEITDNTSEIVNEVSNIKNDIHNNVNEAANNFSRNISEAANQVTAEPTAREEVKSKPTESAKETTNDSDYNI